MIIYDNVDLLRSQDCLFFFSSTVIISTIDGKVTALKAENGEFIWSIPSAAPLLSSSISSAKVSYIFCRMLIQSALQSGRPGCHANYNCHANIKTSVHALCEVRILRLHWICSSILLRR